MEPLGSDDLTAGGKPVDGERVLPRAERRKKASVGGSSLGNGADETKAVVEDTPGERADDLNREEAGVGVNDTSPAVSPIGEDVEEGEDGFDILNFPAPLANPQTYGDDFEEGEGSSIVEEEPLGVETGGASQDGFVDKDLVGWDIIFPSGENPRLVLRAALVSGEDDIPSDDVPVVESSVELSAEDVDRLLKLSHKVEKYHSRGSRFGRRVFNWIMRRKFFAAFTFVILLYLGISEVVSGLR